MIYGSVCSGIEAASCAWEPLGFRPAFFSEVAAFPSAVLASHYPGVPNLGDFTAIGGDHAIDILVGGTPCQSFSVAGLRGGMADARGNLALEFLRLAQRTRARWVVWENVPGVLSSNGGGDFASFLNGLAELGYGFAYRVLDAQYVGVPQRRRRVFVVGYFGDWRRACAVLFERHSLSWDPPPRREAGARVAGTLEARAGSGGYDPGAHGAASEQLQVAHALRADGFDESEDGTGRGTPLVTAFHHTQDPISGPVAPSLGATTGGMGVAAFDEAQITSAENRASVTPGAPAPTLSRQSRQSIVGQGVRRLTPRECERLQGFPDDWTLVEYRGKPTKDGPRYHAIGNSMAVPVMKWIGERLKKVEAQP